DVKPQNVLVRAQGGNPAAIGTAATLRAKLTDFGIAQAAEKAVSNVYKNGAKPSGVLKLDRLLTRQQRDELRASFGSLTTGDNNRLMVLEKGTDFQAISLSPQDIELLSSRKFQISEICRWYGVPSVLVNDNNGTSNWGSGIEQIMQGFYKLTLRPLLEKTEASIVTHLVEDRERSEIEVEFDFNALLRADSRTLIESLKSAVNGALMTPNEARRELNLQPVARGNVLFMQGAMAPVDLLADPPAPSPEGGAASSEIGALASEIRRLQELALAHKSTPTTITPNVHVHATFPEQKHEHHVHATVEGARVTNEIAVPEPVVHVEAIMPEVKLSSPIVNVRNEVAPAPVTVVDNHPTRAIQVVERDADDEIVRTVTTFEK
ncbi:MAG: phage portal protein, partial [Caldilinea sp.]